MTLNAQECYDLLAQIPKGKVTTYKEIAKQLNSKAYRAVGSLIGKNPKAPKVPCHRVVKSDGSIGGYAFGVERKIELLRLEKVEVEGDKVKDFKNKFYKF